MRPWRLSYLSFRLFEQEASRKQRIQLSWIKWLLSTIYEAADAIFFGLGPALLSQRLQPAWGTGSCGHGEEIGVEKPIQWQLGAGGMVHLGMRVELPNYAFDLELQH